MSESLDLIEECKSQERVHNDGHLRLQAEVFAEKHVKIGDNGLNSWADVRSKRVFQVAQYNWIALPMMMACVYGLTYYRLKQENGGWVVIDHSRLWTAESMLFMIMIFPGQLFWLVGFVGSLLPTRPFHLSRQPVKRSFNRLIICLVTRGDQKEVVRRSITSMQDICKKHFEPISLHVVTEERNAGHFYGLFQHHVRIHAVPVAFCALKAKYKARSLEWFRQTLPVHDDDWVLHLDEETIVDEYAIEACLDFMTKQTDADVGTGVIHYNSDRNAYWGNILTTIGDIGRAQQDWGRLRLQADWMHNAALGIHGAFLLVRGAVENAATWETEFLTEDYWFLLRAMEHGYRLGWVPAIAREISPMTVADYYKQRKRWFSGIRQIDHPIGRLVMVSIMWIILEPVYWFICWYTGLGSLPKPLWFYMLMVFELTYDKVIMCALTLLQDWDAGCSFRRMIFSPVLLVVFGFFVRFLDIIAVVAALWAPDIGFYIIAKK